MKPFFCSLHGHPRPPAIPAGRSHCSKAKNSPGPPPHTVPLQKQSQGRSQTPLGRSHTSTTDVPHAGKMSRRPAAGRRSCFARAMSRYLKSPDSTGRPDSTAIWRQYQKVRKSPEESISPNRPRAQERVGAGWVKPDGEVQRVGLSGGVGGGKLKKVPQPPREKRQRAPTQGLIVKSKLATQRCDFQGVLIHSDRT